MAAVVVQREDLRAVCLGRRRRAAARTSMPAAGQPCIVSSTWVLRWPIAFAVWPVALAGSGAKCIHFCVQVNRQPPACPAHPRAARPWPAAAPALRVVRASAVDRRRRAQAASAHGDDAASTATQRIVDSITTAIVERRLMPGTKLAEQKIADIFSVSRTLVRQALNQLSRDRLVTLEPARGAFVAAAQRRRGAPGVRGAAACSKAAMIRQLARSDHADAQIAELRAHLKAERAAVHAHRHLGPHAAAGRLSRACWRA